MTALGLAAFPPTPLMPSRGRAASTRIKPAHNKITYRGNTSACSARLDALMSAMAWPIFDSAASSCARRFVGWHGKQGNGYPNCLTVIESNPLPPCPTRRQPGQKAEVPGPAACGGPL